jgi:hypothetical protein
MPRESDHADSVPGPDDPVPSPDWMTSADWEAWCDATAEDNEPPGLADNEYDEEEHGLAPGEVTIGTPAFAAGNLLDAMPGGGTLAFYAELAAGDDNQSQYRQRQQRDG